MSERNISYRTFPDEERGGWLCQIDDLATGAIVASVRGETAEQAMKMAVRFDTRDTFGGRIRRLRTEQGLTLRALAKQSGVSVAYLSQMECDEKANPSIAVVRQLAKAMQVKLSDLFPDDEPAPPAGEEE